MEPVRISNTNHPAWRLAERRREARFTLILRVGIVEQAGRSFFCLVKNISTAGMQLKTYSPAMLDGEAAVRVADEPPVRGRIAWRKGDIVGMSFFEELDTATLLRVQQKLRANRRRATPRLGVQATATLRTGGRTLRVSLGDISSHGARVRAQHPLKEGERAIIDLADLPPLAAYVRWSQSGEAGLIFETPIPIQIMARWTERHFGASG